MKREKLIGEGGRRVGRGISFVVSVLVLLSIQAASFGSVGGANASDSEMKYLDCGSVISWGLYEDGRGLLAFSNQPSLQCSQLTLSSYYLQMWEGVDPNRCGIFNCPNDMLAERCPDLSFVLPRADEIQTPGKNGWGTGGSDSSLTNRKVQVFGGSIRAQGWDRIGSIDSSLGDAVIGQVSMALAALNVGP
jgi:hypothetical protein